MYTRNLSISNDWSYFLFGPRGVGKSTWLRATYPKAIYIDLLESQIYQKLLASPWLLSEYFPKNWSDFVIIDEVQRIPELLNEVHRLIENDKIKFILTGSSARKLRRGGVNLLAGRALNYKMGPLMAEEAGEDFDLKSAISFGMLPQVFNLKNNEEKIRYLSAYIETYLKEEVMTEGMMRNLSSFARFLEVASFSVGSVLNMAEVARETMVSRKVVESYFEILDDLMLGIQIPAFTKRAKREMVLKPKYYFFDTGVYLAIRPKHVLDTESEIGGAALENLFLQHMLALVTNEVDRYDISYYRTVSGSEVDFVVQSKNKLMAFEIKNSARYSSNWLRGLKQFGRDYPKADLFLLYTGREKMYVGNIQIIPVDEFLKDIRKIVLK